MIKNKIPQYSYSALIENVNKLNKKISKTFPNKGFELVVNKQDAEPFIKQEIDQYDGTKKEIPIPAYNIEIITPLNKEYKINGYTYLGMIKRDNKNDGQVTIYSVDKNQTLFEHKDDNSCHHCKTNRIRTLTFVFNGPDNKRFLLGSTCVKEYFGIDISLMLDKFATIYEELSREIEEEYGFSGSCFSGFNYNEPRIFERAIQVAYYIISKDGRFVKSNGDFMQKPKPTQENVRYFTEVPSSKYATEEQIQNWTNENNKANLFLSDKTEIINSIISYWENINPKNDFEFNIADCYRTKSTKSYSLISWSVYIYMKDKGLVEKNETAIFEHIGNPGDKIVNYKIRFEKRIEVSTQWGNSYITMFRDEKGNSIKWFTNKYIDFILDTFVVVNFIIKSHDEYKGIKQTAVKKLKIINE